MTAIADPREALTTSATALRRLAAYRLSHDEWDRRILDLGERKNEISDDERAELTAWVQFSQERSIEKFGAEAALWPCA